MASITMTSAALRADSARVTLVVPNSWQRIGMHFAGGHINLS